jgi:hypothetical protein
MPRQSTQNRIEFDYDGIRMDAVFSKRSRHVRDTKFGVRSSENLEPSSVSPVPLFRKVRESRMNNEIRFTRNALSGDFAAYRHE